jgi:hypothetical protein
VPISDLNQAGDEVEPSPNGRYPLAVSEAAQAKSKRVKRNPKDFDGRRACQDGQKQIGTHQV